MPVLRCPAWPGGNSRGGFLICAKNQGRQVVKKLHLGVLIEDQRYYGGDYGGISLR